MKGRKASEHSNNQARPTPGFLATGASSRLGRSPECPLPRGRGLPHSSPVLPTISHLSGFPGPPRSTLSEDRRQCRQKSPKLAGVLSTHQLLRRLPGCIPMVTPPSAGSNARAGARAPAAPPHPPMGTGETS